MDFENDSYSHAEFDLSGKGEDSSLRVDMQNDPNQRTREQILSKGEKFTVSATLLEVAHGNWKKSDECESTLLIASFRFIPPKNRRFKYVKIDWTFTSDDPAIDVTIKKIAPDAGWASDPVTLKLEKTIGVEGNLGASITPASAGAKMSYQSKKAKDLVYHTSVTGSSRMAGLKNRGGHNSVRWELKENPENRQGICTMLQVAVLLRRPVRSGMKPKRRLEQTFKSTMEIEVEKYSVDIKGFISGFKDGFEDLATAKTPGDQPVNYHPDEPNDSDDFIIDKNNLGDTDLEEIMFMSTSSSYEELKMERHERKKAKEEAIAKEKLQEEEKEKRGGEDKDVLEEKSKKADGGGAKAAVTIPFSTGPIAEFVQPQRVRDVLPQGQTPAWLYVALGILGMYCFQQFMKSWFGGT
jgi:hypothetical protein